MSKKPRTIDYDLMVENALKGAVKSALQQVEKFGLPGAHHFYISFRTDYPDVAIPKYLAQEYPDDMTIVLQYEFWDLNVNDDHFSLTLCFNDIHERLVIPFDSIESFVDPSVKFGLQFTVPDYIPNSNTPAVEVVAGPQSLTTKEKTIGKTDKKAKKKEAAKVPGDEALMGIDPNNSNVVVLDQFRKKL